MISREWISSRRGFPDRVSQGSCICFQEHFVMSKHHRRYSSSTTTSNSSSNQIRAVAQMSIFEALEQRRLRSATLGGNGTLNIAGTSGDDAIVVSLDTSDSSKLDVKVNDDAVQQFSRASVTLIRVDAGAGNDSVVVGAFVDDDCKIYGGAGDDTLFGGLGDDR